MKIEKLDQRDDTLINRLMDIWENSVRATHLFLKEEDILRIAEYVPQVLTQIPVLIAAKKDGKIVGFMGINQDSLEMLFILDKERGQGIGKKLLEYAILNEHVDRLSVNEQNPQARGFYEYMGFAVERRSEQDDQSNPFPLLHMRYNEKRIKMKSKKTLTFSIALMIVVLVLMLFGIYFGKLSDTAIRIVGITVLLDLVMIVFNYMSIKKMK